MAPLATAGIRARGTGKSTTHNGTRVIPLTRILPDTRRVRHIQDSPRAILNGRAKARFMHYLPTLAERLSAPLALLK